MRDDNRGFSLVELIIVVAITALLVGVMGYGLSLSSGKTVDECARKLTSVIQRARTSTMGKYKTTIKISRDDDGVWAQEAITVADQDSGGAGAETEGERVRIGNKNVKVELDTGSGYTDLSEVVFEFDRGSGALKDYSSGKIYFRISRASKTSYVEIVPLTGKVTVRSTDTDV